jgi:hypothetical protein
MEHDEKLRDDLAASAAKLDASEPQVPDFRFFKNMVDKQQAAARRAQRRQLALFVVVAALIVSAVIVFTGSYPAFIIALQAAAVAGSIVGLAVFFARGRRLKAEAG